MTPDIRNADGSLTDLKTVKKRDGSTINVDVSNMSAAMSSAALSMSRNGTNLHSLWQQMYQTMAIPSIQIGGAPYGQMSAVTAVQSRSRIHRQSNSSKGYSVSKEYPYEVTKNVDNGDNHLIWFERYNSHQYDNRMEAEKGSLEALVKHHNKLYFRYAIEPTQYKRRPMAFNGYNNPTRANSAKVLLDKFKSKLKNIEEEHPEWMI